MEADKEETTTNAFLWYFLALTSVGCALVGLAGLAFACGGGCHVGDWEDWIVLLPTVVYAYVQYRVARPALSRTNSKASRASDESTFGQRPPN